MMMLEYEEAPARVTSSSRRDAMGLVLHIHSAKSEDRASGG